METLEERKPDQSGIFLMLNYKNVMKYSQTRKMVELLLLSQKQTPAKMFIDSMITEVIECASLDNLDETTLSNIITKWNEKRKK